MNSLDEELYGCAHPDPRDQRIAELEAKLESIAVIFRQFQISAEQLAAGTPVADVVREWVAASIKGAEDMGHAISASIANENELEAIVNWYIRRATLDTARRAKR